jgi:hypothetical protein
MAATSARGRHMGITYSSTLREENGWLKEGFHSFKRRGEEALYSILCRNNIEKDF